MPINENERPKNEAGAVGFFRQLLKSGPAPISDPDTSIPTLDRRQFCAYLLAAAAGCKKSPERKEVPPVHRLIPSPKIEKQCTSFDPEKYKPPASYGVIIDSDIKPGRKRTVIYIVDEHPMPGMVTEKADEVRAKNVQGQLFGMLMDLYDKHGNLPIVIENWTYDLEGVDMTQFQLPSLGNDNLSRMFAEKDIVKRQKMAIALAGTDLTPGSMYMMAAFPGVNPLGSVTTEQIRANITDMGPINQAIAISSDPRNVQCLTDPAITLADAKRRFLRGDTSNEVLDCYCLARDQVGEVMSRFIQNRYLDAAIREVNRALAYDGEFVVVSSGLTHLPEAIKHLRASTDSSWILVSPNALKPLFPKALKPMPIHNSFPDSPTGMCDRSRAAIYGRLYELKMGHAPSGDEIIDWMNEPSPND